MQNPFSKLSITEDKKSLVRKWLAGEEVKESPSRLMMRYGQMRKDEKIEAGETLIQIGLEKKQEAYKWKTEKQIKQNIEDYKSEYPENTNIQYELRKIYNREDGRCLVLGILHDFVDGKNVFKKTIEVEERENPKYFDYLLTKYSKF